MTIPRRVLRAAPLLGCILVLTFATGCGGGNSTASTPTPTPTPTPPASASAQVRIGDAAVDSVIAFEFSIGSPIILTQSGGTTVSVTTATNRLEMSHMSAKFEPLGALSVPAGTYTQATLIIQNPELTFLNGTGTPVTIPDRTRP